MGDLNLIPHSLDVQEQGNANKLVLIVQFWKCVAFKIWKRYNANISWMWKKNDEELLVIRTTMNKSTKLNEYHNKTKKI